MADFISPIVILLCNPDIVAPIPTIPPIIIGTPRAFFGIVGASIICLTPLPVIYPETTPAPAGVKEAPINTPVSTTAGAYLETLAPALSYNSGEGR